MRILALRALLIGNAGATQPREANLDWQTPGLIDASTRDMKAFGHSLEDRHRVPDGLADTPCVV